ncbi:MAG: hypothetical protein EPO02_14070 [Nitrospirae bacterium]|nr:MAG: hypothetical protein EPO02_14070 [Nitrospirota bacterium]
MTNHNQNNPPAFPIYVKAGHQQGFPTDEQTFLGMTLRDYFANSAMKEYIVEKGFLITSKEIAKRAYEVADAMLKERMKNDQPNPP